MKRAVALGALFLVFAIVQAAPAAVFNGASDNAIDSLGYYYAITGGKFPTGNIPNGDNASGGTFRFLNDEPAWGYTIDTWLKDDWFPTNAGLAMTLKNGAATVYDNNGIEDGTYGNYYDATAQGLASAATPGLYRGYSMSNNYDWIYATYFKLETDTTFDTIIGYFDPNSGFDPNSSLIEYGVNIFSAFQDNPAGNPNSWMPTNTGGFDGDVFDSDNVLGTFAVSDTGVDRVFGAEAPYFSAHDDIWRLTLTLNQPVTLPAGVYFFNHEARIVPEPAAVLIWLVMGLLGAVVGWRNRAKLA